MLSCLKNFYILVQSGCTASHVHQQCVSIPVALLSPQFGIVSHFNFGHFNRYVISSPCIFYLHFPNVDNVGSSQVIICHMYTFFVELSGHVFYTFYIGFFSYWIWRSLDVFWIQVLYKISDLQIFSLCGLPFHSHNSVFQRESS